MADGKSFGIPSSRGASAKQELGAKMALGVRIQVLERILAMREQELMDRQGPCRDGSCGLWKGHYGPCAIKKVEIKRPKENG